MKLVKVTLSIEEWQREAAYAAKINLSELLRQALNATLNVNTEAEKLERELQDEKISIATKEATLAILKKRTVQEECNIKLVEEQNKWLSEHPNKLKAYNEGTMSQKGWAALCVELKVKNRSQAEKVLIAFQNA